MDVEIQLAEPKDIPAIEALIRSGNLSTNLERCRYVLKASLGGRIVGTVGLEFWGDYVSLRALIVDEQFRKHGIGGALVRRAIRWARRDGALAVYSYTMFWNNKYFRSWGFELKDKKLLPEAIKECAQFHWPHYRYCCAMELEITSFLERLVSWIRSILQFLRDLSSGSRFFFSGSLLFRPRYARTSKSAPSRFHREHVHY